MSTALQAPGISPPSRFAIRFIETYRARVSLRLGSGKCRFTPTCSGYALEAYHKHGFWSATAKTLWRILRCNPLNHGPALDQP